MIVRHATVDDVPALIEMGEAMRRESLVPFPAINRDMVEMVARDLFPRRDVYCALVAEDGGAPAGMLTGSVSRYAFAPDLIAVHDIFFVRPEHRGSGAARLLIQRFVTWARECGARRVLISVHTGITPEKTGRFYRMMGFSYMGGVYCREVS